MKVTSLCRVRLHEPIKVPAGLCSSPLSSQHNKRTTKHIKFFYSKKELSLGGIYKFLEVYFECACRIFQFKVVEDFWVNLSDNTKFSALE